MTLSSRQIRLIAIFAVVNVVLVVAGWAEVISPQRHAAATAAASAQSVQSQIDALHTGGHTKVPTKQPAIHTSCIYKLDTALPSQADQPGLLLELQAVAKASHVRILGISPQTATAIAAGYTAQPINLNLDGSYFDVTRFLYNLRTLVSKGNGCPVAKGPLFAVSSVTFSGTEPDGDSPATAGIEAFYYGVAAGASAPVSTDTSSTTTTTGG